MRASGAAPSTERSEAADRGRRGRVKLQEHLGCAKCILDARSASRMREAHPEFCKIIQKIVKSKKAKPHMRKFIQEPPSPLPPDCGNSNKITSPHIGTIQGHFKFENAAYPDNQNNLLSANSDWNWTNFTTLRTRPIIFVRTRFWRRSKALKISFQTALESYSYENYRTASYRFEKLFRSEWTFCRQ